MRIFFALIFILATQAFSEECTNNEGVNEFINSCLKNESISLLHINKDVFFNKKIIISQPIAEEIVELKTELYSEDAVQELESFIIDLEKEESRFIIDFKDYANKEITMTELPRINSGLVNILKNEQLSRSLKRELKKYRDNKKTRSKFFLLTGFEDFELIVRKSRNSKWLGRKPYYNIVAIHFY